MTDLSVTNDDENKSVQINKDEQGVVKEIVVTNSKYNITVTYSVKYTMLEASAIECDTEYEVSLRKANMRIIRLYRRKQVGTILKI